MSELVLASVWPTERNFESITISQVHFFPKSNLNSGNVTLEAPSLSFWMRKQQSLKEKVLRLDFTMAGKTCSFFDASLLHPYMKQFFFLEWP